MGPERLIAFTMFYFVCCILYFQLVQRIIFMLYNKAEAHAPIRFADLLRIARYGLKSDVIAASYVTAVPMLAATAQAFIATSFLSFFMIGYNVVAGLILALGVVADTALYPFWKIKLDSSVLPYLKSLKGAFASVSTTYIVLSLIALLAMAVVTACWLEASSVFVTTVPASHIGLRTMLFTALAAILLIGMLFAMIRGLGRRPNNPSISFFSSNPFFNHCALNPIYAFIYSLSVNDKIEGAFHAFDDDVCHREFAELFPKDGTSVCKLFNTDRPNILFIIWESLSARFVEELGGQKDVTPNINRLSREGIFFTRVDCNSFRTDRGLVALLSGYLAQPTTSVIRMTKKLPHLPAFPKKFRDAGYDTTAVHGGDLNIFHKAEYYLTVGHDRIIGDRDLPKGLPKGKWGIHDGEVMNWLYDDIMDKTARSRKWFTTFQTLSSHEPWIVPYSRIEGDEVANTFAYVDDALGRLVERLKKTSAWDDLLIVVTGDHGCNTGEEMSHDKYAHIPLLMVGGAVKESRRIDTIMSQSDIASTILGQLGIPHDEFIFSRDVTAESYRYPFSFHTFVNGFMFRDATGYTVVDNVSGAAIDSPDPERERKGRIILQYLYEDLSGR